MLYVYDFCHFLHVKFKTQKPSCQTTLTTIEYGIMDFDVCTSLVQLNAYSRSSQQLPSVNGPP